MTRYENRPTMEDAQQVLDWIKTNIPALADLPMGSALNFDGTVKILEVGKNLTGAEKAQLIAEFPELAGKEI